MKRFVLCLGLVAFFVWRRRAFERSDAAHGFGAYAATPRSGS